jgi:predicted nucleic-acid-binding protein
MPNPTGPPRLHLDANGILRYLLNDLPAQASAVQARLIQARSGHLIIDIHPLVIAEVVFVLTSHYRQPRQKIANLMLTFLNTSGIKLQEESFVRKALTRYASTNVSFVDAFLAVLSAESSNPLFSFDRGLDKFKDIRRIEK